MSPIQQPFRRLTSTALALSFDDVDTDQIIPARFLTTTERRGLGRLLFADWRTKDPRIGAALDADPSSRPQILLVGSNFGSGSSREHAAWALTDWGVRAILGRSFADIFRGNALKNGLLPIETPVEFLDRRLGDPVGSEITIDLEARTVVAGPERFSFDIDPFARRLMLEGKDELDLLRSYEARIVAYEGLQP